MYGHFQEVLQGAWGVLHGQTTHALMGQAYMYHSDSMYTMCKGPNIWGFRYIYYMYTQFQRVSSYQNWALGFMIDPQNEH